MKDVCAGKFDSEPIIAFSAKDAALHKALQFLPIRRLPLWQRLVIAIAKMLDVRNANNSTRIFGQIELKSPFAAKTSVFDYARNP